MTNTTITIMKKKLKRGVLLSLFLLSAILVLAIANANSLCTLLGEKGFEIFLSKSWKITGLEIKLFKGQIRVDRIRCDQGSGFEGSELLQIEDIFIDIDMESIPRGPLTLEVLRIGGLTANPERNSSGRINLWEALEISEENRPAKETDASPTFALKIEKLDLGHISIALRDNYPPKKWQTGIHNLSVNAENLQLEFSETNRTLKADTIETKSGLLFIEEKSGAWNAHSFNHHLKLSALELDGLGQIKMSLGSIASSAQGVEIDQPNKISDKALLQAGYIQFESHNLAIPCENLLLNNLRIEKPILDLVHQENDISNIKQAMEEVRRLFPLREGKEPAEKPSGDGELPIGSITLQTLDLEEGSFLWEIKNDKNPTTFFLEKIQAQVTDFSLQFKEMETHKPGNFKIEGEISQGLSFPSAKIGYGGTFSPFKSHAPKDISLRSSLALSGFMLETAGKYASPRISGIIGGEGFDALLFSQWDQRTISLHGHLKSERNSEIPLNFPDLRKSSSLGTSGLLSATGGRISGGVTDITKSGVGAGKSLTEGGVKAVKGVGSGVVDVGKSLFSGFKNMFSGMVTLDGKQMGKGLSESTSESFDKVRRSMRGAGTEATQGVSGSVNQRTKNREAWLKNSNRRYSQQMKRVENYLQTRGAETSNK